MIKKKLSIILCSAFIALFLGGEVNVQAYENIPQTIKRESLLASTSTINNNLSEAAKSYIRNQLYNLNEEFSLDQFKIPYSYDNANKILDTIVETTEIEYLYDTQLMYYSSGGYISKIQLKRKYDVQTALNIKSQFESKANEIINKYIKSEMSDLEKEVVIHNYLVNNIVYDESDVNTAHNAYGALIKGRAVCDGYSKAFKYFMDRFGIENGLVLSYEMAHAWNYIKIDGVTYFVDITWDDPVSKSATVYKDNLKYFNVTKSKLSEDHNWDTTKYPQVGDDRFSYLNTLDVYGRLDGKYFYYYDRNQNKIWSIDEVTGEKKSFSVNGFLNNFYVYNGTIIYDISGGGIRIINATTGKDDQLVQGNSTFIKSISNDTLYYESTNGEKSLKLITVGQKNNSDSTSNSDINVIYQSHVQNIGWQDEISNGGLSGTEGYALRVEALKIRLGNNAPSGLKIKYRTHVQNVGWQDWVYDGNIAGTEGQSLRVEAIEVKLEGTDADKYRVKYKAHVQNEGWQDWASDGQIAGTFGKSQRVEALKIVIEKKLEVANTNDNTLKNYSELASDLDIRYKTHVQNIGWQDYAANGNLSGTEGQGLRLEAINVVLGENVPQGLKLKYKTHVQNIGWQDWVYNGNISGTEGKSLRLEAIQMQLEGIDADKYSIQYQVHVENEGWLPWVSDGQTGGTMGKSQRLEAIRIKVVKK